MEAPMIAAVALGAAGTAVIAAGVLQSRTERAAGRGVAYLRETTGDRRRVGTTSIVAADLARAHDDDFSRRLSEPFRRRVLRPNLDRLAAAGAAFLPKDHRAHVRAQLAAAGLDARRRPEEIIAGQVAGAIVGLLFGAIVILNGGLSAIAGVLCALVLAIIGIALPQVWLSHQVEARRQAIRRDLPDTLDLLAISVEAGVGLEGAMAVVTERMQSPLSDELDRTLQEMSLGLSRHDALTNLKHRSNVPELTTFVGALLQADVLGMPIGRVLKIQAGEMRAKRRQWSRERAAKLPVKILFPLIACIFPAVLVVVLGPAMSQIGEALK
jgi:tight adherence protein C